MKTCENMRFFFNDKFSHTEFVPYLPMVCTVECEVQVVYGDTLHNSDVCTFDSVEFYHKTFWWTNGFIVMIAPGWWLNLILVFFDCFDSVFQLENIITKVIERKFNQTVIQAWDHWKGNILKQPVCIFFLIFSLIINCILITGTQPYGRKGHP